MIHTRIGTYAITIDDEGVKVARAESSHMTFQHNEALEFADFILSHRADIETMQQQHGQGVGKTMTPPATEPE